MTKEEAIDILKCDISADKQGIEYCHDEVGIEALDMAIKALEQEPSGNLISRDELLKAIDTWDKFGVDDTNSLFRLDNLSLPHYVPYIHYDDVIKCIKGMPSVIQESKPKWIPVSERLPERNMACLVTVGKFNLTQMAMYSDLIGIIDRRIFYQGDVGHYNFEDITEYVKAWMPLPNPYEEGLQATKNSDPFLDEIEKVCKKYNRSISHEDTEGAFILEDYDEYNMQWLRDARVRKEINNG